MKKSTKAVILFLFIALVTMGVIYLIALPAINVSSVGFWCMILAGLGVATFVVAIWVACLEEAAKKKSIMPMTAELKGLNALLGGFSFSVLAILLVLIGGGLSSATIFNASKYQQILPVKEVTFSEMIPEEENISNIAIMDTETAQVIGKRAMGSLTELVSQYEVSESYSTICYKDRPVKVSCLEYGSVIKYFTNKETGIPGYVLVDPVKNTANYVALDEAVHYAPSAVFGEDLLRHIRATYPCDILEGQYFEIDEDGHPWWICPVLKKTVGLFGGSVVDSVILVDACSGDMTKVAADDVPNWVDRVYDGDLLCDYYDDYGTLQNGFWNSLIGKRGCTVTTEDYGYKILNGDVWVYTGVTSKGMDESNVGFVLMNQRNKDTYYVSCGGAEEFSAMAAAEGMVQDFGYVASFPSLVNIGGVPTYLMCLKDGSGLVKQYAMVNVEQYGLVGVGNSQTEALKNYKALLAERYVDKSDDAESFGDEEKEIVIKEIHFLPVGDTTNVYMISEDDEVYRVNFLDCEELITVKPGMKVKFHYYKDEAQTIQDAWDIEIVK